MFSNHTDIIATSLGSSLSVDHGDLLDFICWIVLFHQRLASTDLPVGYGASVRGIGETFGCVALRFKAGGVAQSLVIHRPRGSHGRISDLHRHCCLGRDG